MCVFYKKQFLIYKIKSEFQEIKNFIVYLNINPTSLIIYKKK